MKVHQKLFQYFQNIAKSIVKSQKNFKKYCKFSKVLQKLLQNLKVLQKLLLYFAQRHFFLAVLFFTKF